MFNAYVDDSGRGDPTALVLAGYIAPADQWLRFNIDWQHLLDMRSKHYRHLQYFKMSEMRSSTSEMERVPWFYRVIEKHVVAAISCTVKTAELIGAVREVPWPANFENVGALENPYYFAFKAVIDVLAQHQEELGIHEPVAFVFDEEAEKKQCLAAWDRLKFSSGPKVRRLMGSKPLFRDDRETPPLQAADLWAYWVHDWEINGIADGVEHLRFPWKTTRDIPRLDMRFQKQDFLHEFVLALNDPAVAQRTLMSDAEVTARLSELEARGDI